LDEALRAARFVKDDQRRDDVLGHIVHGRVGDCDDSDTLQIAKEIKDPRSRAMVLDTLGFMLTMRGNTADGRDLLLAVPDMQRRSQELASVAAHKAAAGRFAKALEFARLVEDGVSRAFALRDIANAQAEKGATAEAKATYAEAVRVARDISDPQRRGNALSGIVGTPWRAVGASEALAIAQSIDDEFSREGALSSITTGLVSTGEFAEALNIVRSIRPRSRSSLLSNIATAEARSGQLGDALAVAGLVEGERDSVRTLLSILGTLPD
jgi:hypothetical protein